MAYKRVDTRTSNHEDFKDACSDVARSLKAATEYVRRVEANTAKEDPVTMGGEPIEGVAVFCMSDDKVAGGFCNMSCQDMMLLTSVVIAAIKRDSTQEQLNTALLGLIVKHGDPDVMGRVITKIVEEKGERS